MSVSYSSTLKSAKGNSGIWWAYFRLKWPRFWYWYSRQTIEICGLKIMNYMTAVSLSVIISWVVFVDYILPIVLSLPARVIVSHFFLTSDLHIVWDVLVTFSSFILLWSVSYHACYYKIKKHQLWFFSWILSLFWASNQFRGKGSIVTLIILRFCILSSLIN